MTEPDALSFYQQTTAVPCGRELGLRASELARCVNLAAGT